MTRFLTILTIINLAMVIALSGYYYYKAKNVDITMGNGNRIYLYSINPERKLLLPSERGKILISAKRLVVEDALRKYLNQRYSSILDRDVMSERWSMKGYVAQLSSEDVTARFMMEKDRFWNEIWQERITRDLHIYELEPVHSDLWEAYIETFDFPLEDDLIKVCDCSDNSHECLKCKEKFTIKRVRRKIWLRVDLSGPQTYQNPFGIMVYAYYSAIIPISKEGDKEKYWDLPPALRPAI